METKPIHPYDEKTRAKFWARVDNSGGPEACWLWTGAKLPPPRRYGTLHISKKTHYAHRMSYEIAGGKIPNGHFVCHKCDNPPCCNPAHLFTGTQTENIADASLKGRLKGRRPPRGETVNTAKLTADDVLNIRNEYARGNKSASDLGREYNLRPQSIRSLLIGKSWSHVSGPICAKLRPRSNY